MDEKEVLLHVLTIVDYQDNKADFVTKFLFLIYMQTMENMIENLNFETKNIIKNAIDKASDATELRNIVANHLSETEFDERLQAVTQAQFTDYLETIYPTLTKEKQEELTTFLSTLPKPQ